MDENRIVELETRIAYQELTITELNGVLFEARRDIDALASRMRMLEEQSRNASESSIRSIDEESPPPHY